MRIIYNSSFLAIAILIFLSFFALKSLFISDFYTSHDGETHAARIAQYSKAIKDKQFPPRYADTFYNGYGSPIFVYIYPTPYIIGSIFHLLGFSYINSFELTMSLAFIFSGVFTFLWLKELFNSAKAAFSGALFYMWVPYRFLLIYVRGSISEILAYVFTMSTLYLITKVHKSTKIIYLPILSFSIGLLLLSQNLVALISLPVLVIYAFLLFLYSKNIRFIVKILISFIWGFLISAFTYLPSLFERKFIRFDDFIKLGFSDHFVTLKQLIRSPWGYGFDLPGTLNDQMSFQIGLVHILIVAISILLILISFKKTKKIDLIFPMFFILISFIAVFLMIKSNISVYIWKHYLQNYIDIPWRLLGIITLAASFLAGYVVLKIRNGIFFVFICTLVIIANRNHIRINEQKILTDDYLENYTGTATQYNEFTPIYRQSSSSTDKVKIYPKVEIISGDGNIKNLKSTSSSLESNIIVTSQQSDILINKFYFPQTTVVINGEKEKNIKKLLIKPENSSQNISKDTSGLLLVSLNQGENHLIVKYNETQLRLLANFISLGAILLATGIIAFNVKK